MKEKNIIAGILISDLISFISYLIFPAGIFFLGDFHMLIGVLWGSYFALNHLKKKQKFITYGIGVGLGGSFLSAISIYIFELTLIFIFNEFSIDLLFIILFFFLIEAIIVGVIAGLFMGYYFFRKEGSIKKTDIIEEEFYNSLKEL